MKSRFFYVVSGSLHLNKGREDYIKADAGDILYLPTNVTYKSEWDVREAPEYITFNFNHDKGSRGDFAQRLHFPAV